MLDDMKITNEIMDEKRQFLKRKGVVFKVDFEKNYNHLDEAFQIMHLKGKGLVPERGLG